MSTQLYSTTLSNNTADTFAMEITVGSHKLSCTFVWPAYIQELYDNAELQVQAMRDADPLVGGGVITRDYDYISYYIAAANASSLDTWYESQEQLPQSVAQLGKSTALSIISSRCTTCVGIQAYLDQLAETLAWQCTIVEDGEKTVTDIIPGGLFRSASLNWGVRFTTESLETVNHDQLDRVTMEFEVYDE